MNHSSKIERIFHLRDSASWTLIRECSMTLLEARKANDILMKNQETCRWVPALNGMILEEQLHEGIL